MLASDFVVSASDDDMPSTMKYLTKANVFHHSQFKSDIEFIN